MSEVIARLLVKFSLGMVIPTAIKKGRTVLKVMTGNTYFPNASAAITAAAAGLDQLQTLNATKGMATAARTQLSECVTLFDVLKGVVQQAADTNKVNAAVIIKSASMGIRRIGAKPPKPPLAAIYGAISGTVTLDAKAYGRASYQWQMSTDGTTWVALPITIKCRTAADGLTPGQKYWFRVKIVTKNGERDWVQVGPMMMK